MVDVVRVQESVLRTAAEKGLTVLSTSSAAENEKIGREHLNRALGERTVVAGSKTIPYSIPAHKPQPKFSLGEPEMLSLSLDKVSGSEWVLRVGGRADRGKMHEILKTAMQSIAP